MRIVVREIETMLSCARKDQEIGQRGGAAFVPRHS
jgi:hypothetical protein